MRVCLRGSFSGILVNTRKTKKQNQRRTRAKQQKPMMRNLLL